MRPSLVSTLAAGKTGPTPVSESPNGQAGLPAGLALSLYKLMVRARLMEERMIKMSKSGEGYFWIGGPGEEAFNTCLGLQIHKGEGPDFDYLHLHYRNSATLLAMGMPMADAFRQMTMRVTDPFSRGRNFTGHFSKKAWNIVPVSSVIEIQHVMAPGTAHVQKRHGGRGVTIVTGGDAGSAEGDFASCLLWSSRPGHELPVLTIVTNNRFGISTPHDSQHSCTHIADRGSAHHIPGNVVDGNDVTASWFALQQAFEYCRSKRRPYLLEAQVARLYGHSSSSGAPRSDDPDCIELFERKLLQADFLTAAEVNAIRQAAKDEANTSAEVVLQEKHPEKKDVEWLTYAPSTPEIDAVYPGDYTGLPGSRSPNQCLGEE